MAHYWQKYIRRQTVCCDVTALSAVLAGWSGGVVSVRVGGGGEEGGCISEGESGANGTPADRQVSVVVQSVWCVCV